MHRALFRTTPRNHQTKGLLRGTIELGPLQSSRNLLQFSLYRSSADPSRDIGPRTRCRLEVVGRTSDPLQSSRNLLRTFRSFPFRVSLDPPPIHPGTSVHGLGVGWKRLEESRMPNSLESESTPRYRVLDRETPGCHPIVGGGRWKKRSVRAERWLRAAVTRSFDALSSVVSLHPVHLSTGWLSGSLALFHLGY